MSSFPSSQERTVASSLLLLHTATPSPSFSTPKFSSNPKCSDPERNSSIKSFEISAFSGSGNSSASSVTNDNGFSSEDEVEKIKSRRVSFLSATTRYRKMKFKIARKIRSKVMWTMSCSSHRKPNAGTAAKVSPGSLSGDTSSSLSSSSSGFSSSRTLRYANRIRGVSVQVGAMTREPPPPKSANPAVGSPHLRRRGEAILKLLISLGGSSELRIRQMLGDSPDTSKALRMLLRVDAVKRSGSGGRHDPYVYTITE